MNDLVLPEITKNFYSKKTELQISQRKKKVNTLSILIFGDFQIAFDINYSKLNKVSSYILNKTGFNKNLNQFTDSFKNKEGIGVESYYCTRTKCKVSIFPKLFNVYRFKFICSEFWLNKIEWVEFWYRVDDLGQINDYRQPAIRLVFRNGYQTLIDHKNDIDPFSGFLYPYLTRKTHYEVHLKKCLSI